MRQLIITNLITRRDAKSLNKYLNDISRYEVLTIEEETELFRRFNHGEEHALSQIVLHNLRFVVSVAKQYQHSGLWLGDLINEGNIGLIKAAKRFDVTRGFKFISYAVWWIRQSMLQAITEKGRNIRVPSNHRSNTAKIIKAENDLLLEKERKPSIKELAEATGFPETTVKKCLKSYKKCRSLDAPIQADSEMTLGHSMEDQKIPRPDFHLAVKASQKKEVQQMLKGLSTREAKILSLYYGIEGQYPMSLGDIGDYVGLTKERVRQIKDKSIRKLRIRHHRLASGL